MKRRLLAILALTGMVGGFASAIRDLYRFADRYCGEAEAGGNCRAIANYFARTDIMIFSVSAVAVAILLLIPNPKSTDK